MAEVRTGETPVLLNVGAGETRIPSFINIDARHIPGIDIVTSADDLHMFEDLSVDLIYSCHVLEHFGRDRAADVLREWHRVLRPGGMLRIAVPDFAAVVSVYMKTGDLRLLLGHLVGGQRHALDLHRMVFDFRLLRDLLEDAGFRNIRRYDWRRTVHKDYDDYSMAYWPHMEKDSGVLMSLNIEAEK